jgi:hypothetical protein
MTATITTHTTPNPLATMDADAEQVGAADATIRGSNIYRLSDLESYEAPPGHFIAGKGIVRRKAGMLFTGGTGLGKSVMLADISVWLSAGVPLLDCIPVPNPVRVMYIQAENDPDTMKRDVLSAVKISGADRELVQGNLVLNHVWGLYGDAFAASFPAMCDEHEPDVVIIDPYQSYVNPGDLNGAMAFLEFIGPIQTEMHERNFALILAAHTPKPAQRDWNAREMVYLAAGNSAISNWARTSMELTTAANETDRFRLTFGKNAERNGLVDDETGRPIREMYLCHSGNIQAPYWHVAPNQSAPSKSKHSEAIIELAVAHPSMSYAEIGRAVGCSKGTVAAYYPREDKRSK